MTRPIDIDEIPDGPHNVDETEPAVILENTVVYDDLPIGSCDPFADQLTDLITDVNNVEDGPTKAQDGSMLNIDKIFKSMKSYGRYQVYFFVACQILSISSAMRSVAAFYKLGRLVPGYECHDELNSWSYSADEVRQQSTLVCSLIQNCTNLLTNSQWHSMYEEFQWVCGQDHFLATVQSLTPIGTFMSYMVSGHISDRFGRKTVIMVGKAYSIFSGIACALSPSFKIYLIFTFIGTFIGPISASASFSLIVESVNPKYRLIQGFAFQFSVGYMLAGLLAPLFGHWRIHLLISSLIGVPAFFMLFMLEESPRFLLQKKRFAEAAAVLTRIAKFNGKKVVFSEEEMKRIYDASDDAKTQKAKHYTAVDLFSTPKMAMYAISQIVTGMAMNVINDVFFYNIQDLSGSPFMNIFWSGALRLWTPFVAYGLENGRIVIGRRKLLLLSQGIVCLLLTSMFLIDVMSLGGTARVIGTMAVLVGHTLEFGLVWIAYKLYTTELFPTCVRSIALSTFSCTSLLGSIATPQLTYLSKYWHPAPYSGATLITLLSVGFAAKFLPETHFVALPDTVGQATNRQKLYREGKGQTTKINGNMPEENVPLAKNSS
uniref:MFS domain-containing protein n=1 Tax=Panagrellus redivivus TaxID=6233 RepID=A0A7E4V3A2_PANRE